MNTITEVTGYHNLGDTTPVSYVDFPIMVSSTGFYFILLAGIVDITWGKRLVLMGGAIADLNVDVWSEFVQWSVSRICFNMVI